MSDTLVFNTEEGMTKITVPTFDLVAEDDPILKEVMPEFDFANPPVDPKEFASSLVETCIQRNGYGLSANQCGFRHRVFVMGAGSEYVAFFNPKVTAASEETVHMSEGCLSFPLLELKITRPSGIVVEYQDYNGEVKKANYVGVSARCFLHELDHMNGIVYTEKAKPLALQMAKKKRQKVKNLVKRYEKANKTVTTLNGNIN
jgi:peptide deformylase